MGFDDLASFPSDAKAVADPPVCVITGGGAGIGAATAVEFARQLRAKVVVAGLVDDALCAVCQAVSAAGGEAIAVTVDVRLPQDCRRLVDAALDKFGQIDVIHANAGVVDQSTVAGGDPERWRAVVETNLLGSAFTVRAALPSMLKRGKGHVIFTASMSGRDTYVGEPLYIASKWGLIGFGHALLKEVGQLGIRVTLIEPGLVDTRLTRDSPVVSQLFDQSDPLRPEDVARAVVYAYRQPPYVNVSEIALRPLRQAELTRDALAKAFGSELDG